MLRDSIKCLRTKSDLLVQLILVCLPPAKKTISPAITKRTSSSTRSHQIISTSKKKINLKILVTCASVLGDNFNTVIGVKKCEDESGIRVCRDRSAAIDVVL